jgi:hypothetical protein
MEAKSEKLLILVTRSGSLIGSKCVETFADDYTVMGTDVKPPETTIEETDFVECDLIKEDSLPPLAPPITNV